MRNQFYAMVILILLFCATTSVKAQNPTANLDNITVMSGKTSTVSVLANDLAADGTQATTSNVILSEVSTTNSGVTLETGTGNIIVAAGTTANTYFVYYKICDFNNFANCSESSAAVTVPLDSDGDGIADADDQDKDNDGILDAVEGCEIDGVLPSVTTNGEVNSGTNYQAAVATNEVRYRKQSIVDNRTNGRPVGGANQRGVQFGKTTEGHQNLTGTVNGDDGGTAISANYTISEENEHQGFGPSRYSRNERTEIALVAKDDYQSDNTATTTYKNNDVLSYKINVDAVTAGYAARVTLAQNFYSHRQNSEAGDWVFTWDGGGKATYYDVTPSTTKGPNVTTGGGLNPNNVLYGEGYPDSFDVNNREIEGLEVIKEFATNGGFRAYHVPNKTTRWKVVFPAGATNIKVVKTILKGATGLGVSNNPADGIGAWYPKFGMLEINTGGVDANGNPVMNYYDGEGFSEFLAYKIDFIKDTDGDGIANCLDLDSDNDGCPDALEGGAGFTWDNLVDAQGQLLGGNGVNPVQTPTSGTYNKAVLKNLGIQVGSTGIPTDAGAGQTIGTSNDSTQKAQICIVCTASPFTTGTDLDTPIGISTLKRNTENWVTDKNAFIKLESKKLGFIPTKMTTAQRDALTGVKGMVIWNTTTKCLELYDGTAWKCAKQGCNK